MDPLARLHTFEPHPEPLAICTVIATRGSTYRRPGAALLLYADGHFDGAISGGCVEGEVLYVARQCWDDGAARVCLYDTTADSDLIWGFGIGCKGVVEVLVEPVMPGAPLPHLTGQALAAQRARTPAMMATRLDAPFGEPTALARALLAGGEVQGDLGDAHLLAQVQHDAALLIDRDQAGTLLYDLRPVQPTPGQLCGRPAAPGALPAPGEAKLYLQPVLPLPRLVLFGAGADAIPVAAFARQSGWEVTVVDPRSGYLGPDRFAGCQTAVAAGEDAVAIASVQPDDCCVVMTHHYHRDLAILGDLMKVGPRYIGLMGPRDRTRQLLDDLRQAGSPPSDRFLASLSSPIGLDIGAEGPEQIALSIMGEVLAVRAGTSGGRLREREAALHEPSLGDLGFRQATIRQG